MGKSENVTLVEEAFDAWICGRASFYDLLHPDATWTIPGTSPHCGTWRSRDAFLADIVQPILGCLQDFTARVEKIIADGNTVVVVWNSQATDRGGVRYANNYVYVIEMQAGKASAVAAYLDMAAFNAVWNRNIR